MQRTAFSNSFSCNFERRELKNYWLWRTCSAVNPDVSHIRKRGKKSNSKSQDSEYMYLIFSQRRKKNSKFFIIELCQENLSFFWPGSFLLTWGRFSCCIIKLSNKMKILQIWFPTKNGKKLFYWRTRSPIIQIGPSRNISPWKHLKISIHKKNFSAEN